LVALVREALDFVLPADLGRWTAEARRQRAIWRRDAVPIHQRKPILLAALNRIYDSVPREATGPREVPTRNRLPAPRPARAGHISLVGAGPGDPALLTRKVLARLRAADLVLYDALIDDRVLRYARRAQRFFVGKRAGRHSLSQDAIHGVMIRAARRGRNVVRLKGGDPFVFGRGGEEAIALRRAGIPFEVIPGVTSALAAPALAGIPVTHRGLASAFLVVSGHDAETFRSAIERHDGGRLTLIVLMGANRAAVLAQILVECGWAASTPAAAIFSASRSEQHLWRGTLMDLKARGLEPSGEPVTLVVGPVAALGNVEEGASPGEAPIDVSATRSKYGYR
jgi:uroporphyrin-III C-methyltransferase/precorrin-2 dehydrogenase/sirohydrochlorin ferrochelatase